MMRKFLWIISFVFAVLIAPKALRADGIVYSVNQTEGWFTVTGTITTDGTIGVLSSNDITSWDLTLNGLATIALDTNNSTLLLAGNSLSATAGQLTFDFTAGGSSNSYLGFHDPAYVSWWDVVSQPPYLGYQGITEVYGLGIENYSYISGSQVIAGNGTPVATPEPGTNSLMLIGAGLLGLLVMASRKGISVSHPQAI